MSARRTRKPTTFTVVKDILSYLGGWGLILHQALVVPHQDFNLTLVLLGGTLVGIPGVGQLLAIRTAASQSPDPPSESRPRSSRSSSASEADDAQ